MTRSERAQQVWQVLAGCAANRQVLTYELLGERIGFPRFAFAQVLACVAYYCQQEHMPPLTVLVVEKGGGQPGSGFPAERDDLDKAREDVFAERWDRKLPPTAAALEAAYRAAHRARGAEPPADETVD